jgi:hypothetical protein
MEYARSEFHKAASYKCTKFRIAIECACTRSDFRRLGLEDVLYSTFSMLLKLLLQIAADSAQKELSMPQRLHSVSKIEPGDLKKGGSYLDHVMRMLQEVQSK